MSKRFENKVAVITGAGSGIGFEIANQLVREGASVVLNDIDEALAEEAAEKLRSQQNARCMAFPGDACDREYLYTLVQHAVDRFGRIDMAIANAGITLFKKFLDVTPEDFQKITHLNLQGTFFLIQAATRQMKHQADGGKILLLSSVTGVQAYPDLVVYGMTKAAIQHIAKGLVPDLSPHNITINTIAPGATLTERTLEDPEYEKAWDALIPLGRVARTEDMARAALFLLSPDSSYITGQTLIVDGGWTAIGNYPE